MTGQRLDIWLFRTRLIKSRTLATEFIAKGKVRLTRLSMTQRIKKPGYKISIGDEMSFMRGNTLFQVRVLGCPTRRGPAREARTFYELIDTQTCDSDSG